MHKLPSAVAVIAVAALLAGCSITAGDEPGAASSPASPAASSTPSVAPTPSPSSSPSATGSPDAPAPPVPNTAPTSAPAETTPPATEAPASPAPDTGTPSTGTGTPATAEVAVTPGSEWGDVSISVPQGTPLRVNGSGYEPGQQINLSLGVYQTDSFLMEQVVQADAAGNYSSVITLASDLEPRTYGLLVFLPDAGLPAEEFEASKRSLIIEVVAS